MNLFRREDGRIVAEEKLYLHIETLLLCTVLLLFCLRPSAPSRAAAVRRGSRPPPRPPDAGFPSGHRAFESLRRREARLPALVITGTVSTSPTPLFIREVDTVQMVEAYVRWIALISDRPTDGAPIDSLMRRASASQPDDSTTSRCWPSACSTTPIRPLRNDELYIPVLEALVSSPWLRRAGSASRLSYDLRHGAPRTGSAEPANDFRYTHGRRGDPPHVRHPRRIPAAVHQQSRVQRCARRLREASSAIRRCSPRLIERGTAEGRRALSRRRPRRVAANTVGHIPRELDQRLRCGLRRAREGVSTTSMRFRRSICSTATSACW